MATSEFTEVPREMLHNDDGSEGEPEYGGTLREGTAPGPNVALMEGRREELHEMFMRAARGELPRTRALKSWEPDKLDERHFQVIMLRAAGMDQGRIANMTGFTEPWVSIILNHPDAQHILTRIISYAADNVLDLNKRIQATAHEAFDKVVHVMRVTNDEALASKNAFQILALAGYTAVQKSVQRHEFGVTAEGAADLAAAIREANNLKALEVAEVVISPTPNAA